ncbi:MAG: hypothetical protein WB609_10165 [Candidatus Cybelea sp.]
MKHLDLGRYALISCAAAAMLAGCSGTQAGQPIPTPGLSANLATTQKMSRSSGDLLYVSDGVNDVRVFTIPQGNLVQILTSVSRPQLQCSDENGNVFIGDSSGGKLVEFAHGGKNPINILYLNHYVIPGGCSVDSTTGDVAVAGFRDGGQGEVDVYSGAQGTPTAYTIPGFAGYYACAYDAGGNLYVDGGDASSDFLLAEMRKGSDTFTKISLDATINEPHSLQSEGGYLAITGAESERYNLIYRFKVKGSTAKLVNTILLERSTRSETWIEEGTVAGQFCNKPSARNIKCKAIALWEYPSGGEPTTVIRSDNFNKKSSIRGLSVSVAP